MKSKERTVKWFTGKEEVLEVQYSLVEENKNLEVVLAHARERGWQPDGIYQTAYARDSGHIRLIKADEAKEMKEKRKLFNSGSVSRENRERLTEDDVEEIVRSFGLIIGERDYTDNDYLVVYILYEPVK